MQNNINNRLQKKIFNVNTSYSCFSEYLLHVIYEPELNRCGAIKETIDNSSMISNANQQPKLQQQ